MRFLPLMLIAALAVSSASAKNKPDAPPATVAAAAGPVTAETGGKSRAVKAGDALADGDAVATGAGSTALIELADGSRLKLRESSRLVLNLPKARSPWTDILLTAGSAFAKVTKRAAGAEFRVRTPSAVAAVRGTRFFTAYGREKAGKKDLWVCVDEGAVEIGTDASKQTVLVPAGKGVLIKSGLDTTKPQAYDWTKKLNWNMDPGAGKLEDATNLDAAYADLLDQDYR